MLAPSQSKIQIATLHNEHDHRSVCRQAHHHSHGTNRYVQADGVLAQVGAGGASYPLADALGSIRGVADGAGSLTASADYDVFGAVRAGSSTGTFGFTGEQTDAESGLSFLRARSYDPSTGRFLSADTVQPNAPGTQGYNRYAYVANNPTTWADPSGHTTPQKVIALEVVVGYRFVAACLATDWCKPRYALGAAFALRRQGGPAAWGGMSLATYVLVACAMDIQQVDRPGPPGVFIRGGDRCFEQYTKPNPHIPDCSYQVADLCIPKHPGGAGEDCLHIFAEVCYVPPPGGPDGPGGDGKRCRKQQAITHISAADITEEGIRRIERHLRDLEPDGSAINDPGNQGMLTRLRSGLQSAEDIAYYEHELTEIELMAEGLGYNEAHRRSLQMQGLNPDDVCYLTAIFHPEVIRQYPEYFPPAVQPE